MRDFPSICAGPDVMEYGGLVIARVLSRSQSCSLPPCLKAMTKLTVVNCSRSRALRRPMLKWVLCRARGERGRGTQFVILDAAEKQETGTVPPSQSKVKKCGQPALFSHFQITTYLQIVSTCLLKSNMWQILSQCGTQIMSSFTRDFILWSGKTLLN